MLACICHLSTEKMEAGGSGVQGQLLTRGESKVSMSKTEGREGKKAGRQAKTHTTLEFITDPKSGA